MKGRHSLKICGASGQGIDSAGEILARVLKESGYKVFAYREYPSLIKGGHASYQIDFSDLTLRSSSATADLIICLDRASLHAYLMTTAAGGTFVHNLPHIKFSEQEQKYIEKNNIHVEYIDTKFLVDELGSHLFTNIFFLGMLCHVFSIDTNILKELVREEYADKPQLVELDIKAIDMGCDYSEKSQIQSIALAYQKAQGWGESLLMTGNEAIALGAISAGVRAYFGYPMTPSSSILAYLADVYHETGMLVKQAEDEITAAQMTLGASFAGTRAMTGTSGGGFDLMTESLSLAGITETPFVCVIAQRPGPATGVPTWTAAGDLNLAIYSGHGEFPRCVIAVSDVSTAYDLTQEALNIAEIYQIPVLILTEKQIAESLYNVMNLPSPRKITRGLVLEQELAQVQPTDRFKITENGISKRWLPGSSDSTYLGNSDEHLEDGTMTEDAEPVKAMMDKRMRKHDTLKAQVPEPKLYGKQEAETVLVGWGSVKNTVLDVLDLFPAEFSYLHYEYMWPLPTAKILELMNQGKKLVLVENNATGQLGQLLAQQAGVKFEQKILKYDGRPFFIEDIINQLSLAK